MKQIAIIPTKPQHIILTDVLIKPNASEAHTPVRVHIMDHVAETLYSKATRQQREQMPCSLACFLPPSRSLWTCSSCGGAVVHIKAELSLQSAASGNALLISP